MKTMRDFVTDDRLHRLLDVVESWIGYTLPAAPMPLHLQDKLRCRMHQNEETELFELLYIEQEPQRQSTYCHELAHLILWINGSVVKYYFRAPIPEILFSPPVRYFSEIIWEYMQHVPLFVLVKELGFDEIPDYDPIAASLIKPVRQNHFFPVPDVQSFEPLKDQMRCQACVLVKYLALPMTGETRAQIRTAAMEKIPRTLELADAILSALGPRSLLGPQEYQEYLLEIFRIAGLPIGNLKLSFLDRISPNFRSRILEAAKL